MKWMELHLKSHGVRRSNQVFSCQEPNCAIRYGRNKRCIRDMDWKTSISCHADRRHKWLRWFSPSPFHFHHWHQERLFDICWSDGVLQCSLCLIHLHLLWVGLRQEERKQGNWGCAYWEMAGRCAETVITSDTPWEIATSLCGSEGYYLSTLP